MKGRRGNNKINENATHDEVSKRRGKQTTRQANDEVSKRRGKQMNLECQPTREE